MNKALRIWSGASLIGGWFVIAANLSYAQTVCQDARLTASDPGVFESFGYSVAVSGDTAVVGAQWDSELGTKAGAAYIFSLDPDSSIWIEQQKLLASDGESDNRFGSAVAIDGEVAVIGAFGHFHSGKSGSGSAYVFRYDGSGWNEEQELLASDGVIGDHFGRSLSLSADTIVVGQMLMTTTAPNPDRHMFTALIATRRNGSRSRSCWRLMVPSATSSALLSPSSATPP